MNTFKKFVANGFILTGTTLLLRWLGVVFNTYISNVLGSEGMGVYSLVQSVFGFAVTFACSGINLGTTRLVSEALANNRHLEVKKSLKYCIIYSILFSLVASIVMFIFSDKIGSYLLGDARTVKIIKILALSLPFISLSSVFNGYFSAVRKVYKSASVMILENLSQIFITIRLFSFFGIFGVEYACISVAIGTLAAEVISMLYNLTLLLVDIKNNKISSEEVNPYLPKKLINISLPLALSAYARSGLVTIEHLLIPFGLRKNGSSYSESMSLYGLIHGMVFPIIMFPSCIVYSFAGLLVPELAEYNEKKEFKKINKVVSVVLKYALEFSVGVAGILMCFSYELSVAFYNSAEAYQYIQLFAPLVVVMYLDASVDGLLKGLNEQLYSMKVNIADALISVVLVYTLIPIMGVKGYIIAIFVCEIFNCGMSLIRLVKICEPKVTLWSYIFKPIACIIISTSLVTYFFHLLNITNLSSTINLIIRIGCTAIVYVCLLLVKHKRTVTA